MDVKRLLCLFGLSISLQLQAQSTINAASTEQADSLFELSLDELLNVRLVTAASGFEQNLDDAPATVSVIEHSEWRARGDNTLFEAIDHLPGVQISSAQTGLNNDKAIIRGLSGTFGEQILILMDGIPFRTIREGGSLGRQRVPLNGIKRIEVIRSPGSAVYGADAVGGIINLVSFNNNEAPRRLTLRAGDFQTTEAELNHRWQGAKQSLQVAFSGEKSAGDDDRIIDADFQSQVDQLAQTSASNAPGIYNGDYNIYTLNLEWQAGPLSVRYLDWNNLKSGDGVGMAQSLDPNGEGKMRSQMIDLNYTLPAAVPGDMTFSVSWRRVNAHLRSKLFPDNSMVPVGADGNINFTDVDRLVLFPDGVIGEPGNDDRAIGFKLDHVVEPWQNHIMRWSIGYEHINVYSTEQKNFGSGVIEPGDVVVDGTLTNVTGTPYVFLPEKTRQNRYVSLQDQWQMNPNWIGTLGVRYDEYSDFGSTINPRLGLVWNASRKLIFKSFAGTAFRAPSFINLYAQNNPAGLGNPELEPEEVATFDSGVTTNYLFNEAWQMNLHVFRYDAKNLITFVADASAGVQTAQNSGRLKVRGVEYELSWFSGERVKVDVNYTLLDNYANQNVDTSSVPEKMANALFNYKLNNINIYAGAKWVAERQRALSDPRPQIADYTTVDARLYYARDQWEWGFGVKNIFNEDAREPSNGAIANDYPALGRQWLVDLTYYLSQ